MKKSQVKPRRIEYIDVLRAIAIILVVIGHITYPNFSSGIHKWIYAFHIPLFFVVSGMTKVFTDYCSITPKQLLKKRLMRIYLPFLFWGILLALPNISLMSIPKILYGTHASLGAVTLNSLWFFPVLFVGATVLDLILYFLNKRDKLKFLPIVWLGFICVAILIVLNPLIIRISGTHNLPLGLDIVPMAVVFMIAGYYLEVGHQRIRKNLPAFVLIMIATVCLGAVTFFSLYNNVEYVLMAENRYGNLLYFFAAAIAGIMVCFLVSLLITRYCRKLSLYLHIIGENTLIIFILQRYPIILLSELLLLISPNLSNWVIVPIFAVVITQICLLISLLIGKYLPLLAGKQEKF